MGRTSSFFQTLSHFRSRNTCLHIHASPSILLYCNCSVQNTLTWSLGSFKSSSPASCNKGTAEDHFQPSVFLSASILVFRVNMVLNIALNLWRRLIAWLPPSVLSPFLDFSCSPTYCTSLCLIPNNAGAQSGPGRRVKASEAQNVTGTEEGCGTEEASALVTLSHSMTMQVGDLKWWQGLSLGGSWSPTLGAAAQWINRRQPFFWLPFALYSVE